MDKESGIIEVHFDPEKRCNYHLLPDGTRVDHGVPEGFAFGADGELRQVKKEADE